MATLRVHNILPDRILVSRESARLLHQALGAMFAEGRSAESVVIDFEGVSGVAPSFLDELFRVLAQIIGPRNGDRSELILANPPTRLSSKFEAVARGHGMSVRPRDDGSWVLAPKE